MFRYKQWTPPAGASSPPRLPSRGLTVSRPAARPKPSGAISTRFGPAAPVDAARRPTRLAAARRPAGARRASIVGPDTSVTHLAAAAGCPTVALYGPTDPRLWGPWPVGGLDAIWAAAGTIQRRGNVWLVQNAFPCTPCQLEGCERRLDSDSQCLIELRRRQVIAAVDQALAKSDKAVRATSAPPTSNAAACTRYDGVSKVTKASATRRDVQEKHAADDLASR